MHTASFTFNMKRLRWCVHASFIRPRAMWTCNFELTEGDVRSEHARVFRISK